MNFKYIAWFDQINLDDTNLVGGKNASLGELVTALSNQDVRVPPGFAITSKAYLEVIEQGGIEKELTELLGTANKNDQSACQRHDETQDLAP